MVSDAVPADHTPDPEQPALNNADPDQLHLILTPLELDIIVDALRTVGNDELAERFEAVLRQFTQGFRRLHDS